MSKQLVESILSNNMLEANDMVEAKLAEIRERKLYEMKRMFTARLDEVMGGRTIAQAKKEMRARGQTPRRASDVYQDPRSDIYSNKKTRKQKKTPSHSTDLERLVHTARSQWAGASFGERKAAVKHVNKLIKQYAGGSEKETPKKEPKKEAPKTTSKGAQSGFPKPLSGTPVGAQSGFPAQLKAEPKKKSSGDDGVTHGMRKYLRQMHRKKMGSNPDYKSAWKAKAAASTFDEGVAGDLFKQSLKTAITGKMQVKNPVNPAGPTVSKKASRLKALNRAGKVAYLKSPKPVKDLVDVAGPKAIAKDIKDYGPVKRLASSPLTQDLKAIAFRNL